MAATKTSAPACHYCGSTTLPDLVHTKVRGWQCRSAKACLARMTARKRDERVAMVEAHAEGWHTPPDGEPREFCPDCAGRL